MLYSPDEFLLLRLPPILPEIFYFTAKKDGLFSSLSQLFTGFSFYVASYKPEAVLNDRLDSHGGIPLPVPSWSSSTSVRSRFTTHSKHFTAQWASLGVKKHIIYIHICLCEEMLWIKLSLTAICKYVKYLLRNNQPRVVLAQVQRYHGNRRKPGGHWKSRSLATTRLRLVAFIYYLTDQKSDRSK